MFGMSFARKAQNGSLGMGLLFGFGLLLGVAIGPTIAIYAKQPNGATIIWQAVLLTGLFIACFGTVGYATKRDLAPLARIAMFALFGLLIVAIIGMLVFSSAFSGIYTVWLFVALGGLHGLHDVRLPADAPRRRERRRDAGHEHLPERVQRIPDHPVAARRRAAASRTRPSARAGAEGPALVPRQPRGVDLPFSEPQMLSADPVSYSVAFAAGFVSFASPCVLPLVPAYLGVVSGVGFDDFEKRRWAVFFPTAAFVIGFTLVFMALGASVGFAGTQPARAPPYD